VKSEKPKYKTKFFIGTGFLEHGYFSAEKFLELVPSRSLGSRNPVPQTNFVFRLKTRPWDKN